MPEHDNGNPDDDDSSWEDIILRFIGSIPLDEVTRYRIIQKFPDVPVKVLDKLFSVDDSKE